jgi:hypothetical protein
MTSRDTFNSSVASAETQRDFTGLTGNTAAAPSFANQTQRYPSIRALRAALAAGQISQAQYVSYALATEMACQVQIRAAKDVLVNAGDLAPA